VSRSFNQLPLIVPLSRQRPRVRVPSSPPAFILKVTIAPNKTFARSFGCAEFCSNTLVP
jgi:hypothetical protein